MDKEKLAKLAFGMALFIASMILMGWLFMFLAGALNEENINPLGVISILGVLIFGTFYLFKIAVKIMGGK